MSTQALQTTSTDAGNAYEGADLSGEALRIMALVEARPEGVGPRISAVALEPLFATDAPGVLQLALAELCRKHYLRRTDGWHYELRHSLA